MPIVSSQIIEDSEQADGRRWVTEEHTNSSGEAHQVTYLAPAGFDITARMNARVDNINQSLINNELSVFLHNIESGNTVLGLGYPETTTTQRFEALHEWGKDMIRADNYQALRYLPDTLDQVTDQQLDNLVGETVRVKIRSWAEKITAMNLAVIGMEV